MPGSRASPNHWTLKQLEQRRVRYDELVPCRNAFIDTRNPGSEDKENFTIVGPGVSENPEQHVHISEPHGFVHDGALDCVASAGEVQLSTGDTMSLPEHLHRGWKARSHTIAFVVRGGNVLPPLVRA
jgi:hypothetical protein